MEIFRFEVVDEILKSCRTNLKRPGVSKHEDVDIDRQTFPSPLAHNSINVCKGGWRFNPTLYKNFAAQDEQRKTNKHRLCYLHLTYPAI